MRATRTALIGAALLLPLLVGVLLSLAAGAGTALAQAEQSALGGKFRTGQSVVVPADETVPGDLYISGSTVRVEGRVEGDLVAAGGDVEVTGTVTGDALLAGGTTAVSGTVEGDVRVAAGTLTITGEIAEDLLATGGQLRLSEQAQIGEDFVFGGGDVRTRATVGGNILGAAGTYAQDGTVGGEERVSVAPEPQPPTAGDRVLSAVRRYVVLLVLAALLLWLAPRLARRGAERIQRQPLQSLGMGLLGAVGGGIGVVVLLVVGILLAVLFGFLTLGGLAGLAAVSGVLAALLLAFALVVILGFLAHIVVGLWLGGLVLRRDRSPERGWAEAWAAAALGLLVIVVVTALPYVGGWIGLVIALLGLGALLLGARRPASTLPAPPPAEAPAPAPAP